VGERFLDENFNEKKKLKNYKFYKKKIFLVMKIKL